MSDVKALFLRVLLFEAAIVAGLILIGRIFA
jgi:hypothetical protein